MKTKKILIWSGLLSAGGIFALLLFAAVTYLLLLYPPVQQYVVRFAEDKLDSILVGDVTVGRVQSNLISSVNLYDIKIRDRTGRDDSISVGHIKARYSILPLFLKTIKVSQVRIHDVTAALSVAPDGELMIPALPLPSLIESVSGGADTADSMILDWDLIINDIRIKNINAVYRDSALQFVGSISRAEGRARFMKIDSFYVELRVPDAYYESPWWKGALDTIWSSAIIEFDGMTVLDCFVQGSGTDARGKGRIAFTEEGFWDLSGSVSSSMEPVLAIHGLVPGVKSVGHLQGQGSWTGTLQKPLLSFSGFGTGLQYEFLQIDSMRFDGKYEEDFRVRATSSIFSSTGSMRLSADGEIQDLMSEPVFGDYEFSLQADRIALPKLKNHAIVPVQIPGEMVSLTMKVTGSGIENLPDQGHIHAVVGGGNLRNNSLDLHAGLGRGLWNIDLIQGKNRLTGNGNYSLTGTLEGTVTGDFQDVQILSSLFIQESINGELSFQAGLQGTIQQPHIQASVSSKDLSWRSTQISSMDATIAYRENELFIDRADVTALVMIDSLMEYLDIDSVGGRAEISVQASGNIQKIDISGQVAGSGVHYGVYRADSVFCFVSVTGLDTISWKKLHLRTDHTLIDGSGSYAISSSSLRFAGHLSTGDPGHSDDAGYLFFDGGFGSDSLHGTYRITNLNVESISPWVPLEGYRGLLNASGTVYGVQKNPGGEVSFRFSNPEYKGRQIGAIQGKVVLSDSSADIDTEVYLKKTGSAIKAYGQVPFLPSQGWVLDTRGGSGVRVVIEGEGVDLSGTGSLLGPDWNTDGLASVDIEIESQDSAWILGGEVKVQKGSASTHNIAISGVNLLTTLSGTVLEPRAAYTVSTGTVSLSGGKIDSTYFKGAVGLDSLNLSAGRLYLPQNGLVEFSARVPLSQTDSLLLKSGLAIDFVVVRFPLILLSSFTQDNLIRGGECRGDGRIRIDRGRPVVTGRLGIAGGKLEIPDIDPGIGPLNAELVMLGDSVYLKEMSGKWGKGTFEGAGFATWSTSGLNDLRVDVRSKDLSFEMVETAEVKIQSARIQLNNRREGFLLSGNVNMGPTRIIRDLRITDLLPNRGFEPDPLLQKFGLQIKVNTAENVTVDMNLGYLETDGEIAVTGTAAEPVFAGEINITSGYILYLDRKFEISKGAFYNYDPYKLNPIINLEAQTEVISVAPGSEDYIVYTIYLAISGNLEKPEVLFRAEVDGGEQYQISNQADIISILTLGQPLGSIGGDLGERLRTFAGESLLGFGSRKLEQLLGIERIDIRGDIFDLKSAHSPRLTVTKRFTSRMILSYETVLGDLTRRRISALFRLTRRFFVKGETDSDGESGLDLIFKFSR